MKASVIILCALSLLATIPAAAQEGSAEVTSPSTDLYLKRRPATGAMSGVPSDLEPLLARKENAAVAKRREAIKMLEELLGSKPIGATAAEATFKLAELYWEEAHLLFLQANRRYQDLSEACRQRTEKCTSKPREPRLNLKPSEKLYLVLVHTYPNFRRIDLVKYLLGFAAREAGRNEEGLIWFRRVIQDHPSSRVLTDSWMMIGEYYFATGQHFSHARDAYAEVLKNPDAPSYDVALFKSAWCDWKMGDTTRAAKRFKEVLDLAAQAQISGTTDERRRRAQLRDEALTYLILLFTEDESVSAKEAYEFLASIDGERYSREVLVKLAAAFFGQSRYERAVEAYKFLIDLDRWHIDAPKYQQQAVESYLGLDDPDLAIGAAKTLAESYGKESDWAKENKLKTRATQAAIAMIDTTLRELGRRFHGEAQNDEKRKKRPDVKHYTRAASVYAIYLEHFKTGESSAEVRFFRAEILHFKLRKYGEAGDEYLAVGKTAPVGKYHKQALLKAMKSYEDARPNTVAGKRELGPMDRKFAEATDLYATLFPADPEIVLVIFRNGKMFFDYHDYDEAIKRFGLIITKYPNDPNAASAGDHILESLVKAENYENVEEWARKLRKSSAFKSDQQRTRLDRLIVESIGKSAEKYSKGGHYERAAGFYMRVATEFPNHPRAAVSLLNAAVVLEKAKKPLRAADTYLLVEKRYAKNVKLAGKAAFAAAEVYEQMAYFDRAADAYSLVATKYPRDQNAADALYNAAVLAQAQGETRTAIKRYERYAGRYRRQRDAQDVAFRVGVVHEDDKNYGRAAQAYESYLKRYRGGTHSIEAHTRAGRVMMRLGQEKNARVHLSQAIDAWKKTSGDKKKALSTWGAEARYLQGEMTFRDYQRISLEVKPRKLGKTLDRKSTLLGKAQNVYLDVAEYGNANWGTAALFRIGQMYEQFADELRNAPIPPGFSEQEQEVYREEIDRYVVDVEDKALIALESGYKKALELHVYNTYTKLLRESLARLAKSSYPPEREVRLKTKIGDSELKLPIVLEVVRGE